eukprot:5615679-Pyramimonas_sp.AAC.1
MFTTCIASHIDWMDISGSSTPSTMASADCTNWLFTREQPLLGQVHVDVLLERNLRVRADGVVRARHQLEAALREEDAEGVRAGARPQRSERRPRVVEVPHVEPVGERLVALVVHPVAHARLEHCHRLKPVVGRDGERPRPRGFVHPHAHLAAEPLHRALHAGKHEGVVLPFDERPRRDGQELLLQRADGRRLQQPGKRQVPLRALPPPGAGPRPGQDARLQDEVLRGVDNVGRRRGDPHAGVHGGDRVEDRHGGVDGKRAPGRHRLLGHLHGEGVRAAPQHTRVERHVGRVVEQRGGRLPEGEALPAALRAAPPHKLERRVHVVGIRGDDSQRHRRRGPEGAAAALQLRDQRRRPHVHHH